MAEERKPGQGGEADPQDGIHYDLRHIRQKDLTPAELSAVVRHQDEMEKALGRKVQFEEALADWMKTMGEVWRAQKFRDDMEAQRREIEKFKWIESEKAGQDIGATKAAAEWIARYAGIWRKERESLVKNGWEYLHVIVGLEHGLHMRPSSTLANIAGGFRCSVYVHRDGMEVYNFVLEGTNYLNVKSLMGLLTLGAVKGVMLMFISSGPEARKALEAIGEFVSGGKPELIIIRSWDMSGPATAGAVQPG